MQKKAGSLIIALLLVFCFYNPVSAAPIETPRESAGEIVTDCLTAAQIRLIGPQWDGTSYVTHGITIDSNGRCVASVSYNLYYRDYTVDLEVTLQQRQGSTYVDYAGPWTDSGTGSCFFSKSYYVVKGTYRLKTVGTVYDANGSYVESVPLYSTAKTYS